MYIYVDGGNLFQELYNVTFCYIAYTRMVNITRFGVDSIVHSAFLTVSETDSWIDALDVSAT